MSPLHERRLLQACILIACLVPLAAGGGGVIDGAGMLKGVHPPFPSDLDSHFRYLSGLLLGMGLAMAWLVPNIERNGTAFRLLGAIIILGGMARLWSALDIGLPSGGHRFGLAMELIAVPLLMAWQARVARRSGGGGDIQTS